MTARNIDILVESHRLARERRKAGKPVWDRTIDVRAILKRDPENDSDEHVAKTGNEVAALLRAQLPAGLLDITHADYDQRIDEVVEALESMSEDDYADDPTYRLVDEFNGRMSELYDWADLNRIWMGS